VRSFIVLRLTLTRMKCCFPVISRDGILPPHDVAWHLPRSAERMVHPFFDEGENRTFLVAGPGICQIPPPLQNGSCPIFLAPLRYADALAPVSISLSKLLSTSSFSFLFFPYPFILGLLIAFFFFNSAFALLARFPYEGDLSPL